MYISGAKFKEHCLNISRDILDWVLKCFSGTTYDVITSNTKTWTSLKRKKVFQKGKRHSSLLWKAFQISSKFFFYFIGTLRWPNPVFKSLYLSSLQNIFIVTNSKDCPTIDGEKLSLMQRIELLYLFAVIFADPQWEGYKLYSLVGSVGKRAETNFNFPAPPFNHISGIC